MTTDYITFDNCTILEHTLHALRVLIRPGFSPWIPRRALSPEQASGPTMLRERDENVAVKVEAEFARKARMAE